MSTPVLTNNTLDAYLNEGFSAMHGWLFMPAVEATLMLAELQRQFMKPGPVSEIGVWEGRYLTLLSFVPAKPQPVLGIDPFIHGGDRAAQLKRVHDNIARYARQPELVTLLEEYSAKVTASDVLMRTGAPCQFVSVDGDHTMEGCLYDLRLAEAISARAGIVSVDDFPNLTCPGVAEATIRYLLDPLASLAPFLMVGNKLFLAHREYVDLYRQGVIERCRSGQWGHAGQWGQQVIAYYDQMNAMRIPVRLVGHDLLVYQ
jgi:hypothetical protein